MYPQSRASHNWLIKRALNRLVAQRLPAFSGTVLDLGCGSRPFETEIRRHCTAYFGIDWSLSMHRLAADVAADLNRPLPIADSCVDHVVCFEVIEHLAEPIVLLEEARRVLRAGGTLTLSVPFQWWVHEAPWDYYRFTEHGVRHILKRAGFEDVVVRPTTGFWSMWVLKLNYQLARLVAGSPLRRAVTRLLLVPVWFLAQCAALALDKIWREERETAGYFATAKKS